MGLCPRPLEPREAPVGRSPTTGPRGPLPPDKPDLFTFSSLPRGTPRAAGRLAPRRTFCPGQTSDTARKWHDLSPARRSPRSAVYMARKRKASVLLLTWGIWSQRVTSPWACPDILAGTCTPELLQGRGWAPGCARRAGRHVAVFGVGGGLAGSLHHHRGHHDRVLTQASPNPHPERRSSKAPLSGQV